MNASNLQVSLVAGVGLEPTPASTLESGALDSSDTLTADDVRVVWARDDILMMTYS